MLAEFTFSIPAVISELFPLLIAVFDLLLKAVLLIAFTVLVLFVLRRLLAASTRHFFWLSAILSLALLPLMPLLTDWLSVSPSMDGPTATIPAAPQLITLSDVNAVFPSSDVAVSDGASPDVSRYLPMLLLGLYALPVMFFLAKLIYSARYIRRVHSRSDSESELDLVIRVNHLRKHFAISRPVAVRFSREVESPVSFGLLKPQIVFPATARHWPARVFESALLHEFAHVQRLDWLTSALAYVVCCFFWFNPLVWFAWRELNKEAENACDSAAVQAGIDSEDYAEDLLTVTRHCKHFGDDKLLIQSVFGPGTLKQRVELLLAHEGEKKSRHTVIRFALLSCSTLLLALFSSSSLVGVNALVPLRGETSISELWSTYREFENRLEHAESKSALIAPPQLPVEGVDLTPLSPITPIAPAPVLAADTVSFLEKNRRASASVGIAELTEQRLAEPESLPVDLALGSPRDLVPQYRLQESAVEQAAEKPYLITATQRRVSGMSKSELNAEIVRAEDAFYERFNAIIDDKSMRIECGTYRQTGSFIPERYCEPQFLIDARSAALRNGFESSVFEIGLSRHELRNSVPNQFRELKDLMNASLQRDETLRQLYLNLAYLREEQA